MPTADPARSTAPSVMKVIWSCTRSTVLGSLLLGTVAALLIGLVMTWPRMTAVTTNVWYGWARWMTDDYTALKIPTLMFWGSLMVMLWSLCIALKLTALAPVPKISKAFWVLAALALLMGMVPALCAIAAISSDQALSWVLQQNAWIIAGTATYGLMLFLGGLVVLALFVAFMFLVMDAASQG